MKVERAATASKREQEIKIKDVPLGYVFRFSGCTIEEALSGKDDTCFYMVVKGGPQETGRVSIVSVDGKQMLKRDDDHMVIAHPATLLVGEPSYA